MSFIPRLVISVSRGHSLNGLYIHPTGNKTATTWSTSSNDCPKRGVSIFAKEALIPLRCLITIFWL